MKLAVIGAGAIGTCTAYELAADGHEVTVFERHSAAAEEGSFANAGVVAPGWDSPWAAPSLPLKALQQLFQRNASFRLRAPLGARELAWMWQWFRCSRPEQLLASQARMQRLAFYSRERLYQLTTNLELDYDSSQGFMVLLKHERDHRRIAPRLQVLKDSGVAFEELTPAQARLVEPGLHPDAKLHSALYMPDDGVANCRQFTLMLKARAQELGAIFEFNTPVARVESTPLASVFIAKEARPRQFDGVVMCAGVASAGLLARLGLRLPMLAVHGHSISAPLREPLDAPRGAVLDERRQISVVRLGNRVRVSGGAEIGGSGEVKTAATLRQLYQALQHWFPGAARLANRCATVQEWKGAQPMLPDGPPLIGASGLTGLWLNTGHGAHGWGTACGSARVLADLIAGKAPEIDMEGLGVSRLRSQR